MKRQSGALRIFLYNWPTFVLTWLAAALAVFAATRLAERLPGAIPVLLIAGGATAIVWSLLALAISAYVYDVSELLGGSWLPRLLPAETGAWANVHAGLDAEIELDGVMPGRCVARLDVFDPAIMTAPSIARARARTPSVAASTPCEPARLALGEASCDAVIVAFTAHELRDVSVRERFFHELHRALRPGGRAVLVEHLRDVPNFVAYGPGFLHFLPRSEWLRLGELAGFRVAREIRVTPLVMALALERPS